MKDDISVRVINEAEHILSTKATVRETAMVFEVSKSTVHKDMSERLLYIDKSLYEDVKKILEFNKAERHIRGGSATKEKYATIVAMR
ncbi:MAG: sporulation transcriptional regulator SpoIIID [Firmicutes bacterium]|nr:sporulation transcriptional regulator SpoIIID [Bacillota bacterium]